MSEFPMTAVEGPGPVGVVVNGLDREVPAGLTAAGLLDHLGLHPGMVVVELNREIVRRDDLGSVRVEPGDRIELVHFVGGG